MVHSSGLLPDFPYPSDIGSKAMWKRKERIGLRYIEIVKSSIHEIRSSTGMGPLRMRNVGFNRFDPYERIGRPSGPYGMLRSHYGGRFEPLGGFGRDRFGPLGRGRELPAAGPGHHVHMRGLPFRAGEQDIYNFFKPLKPMSVRILYDTNGRSTGEAHVEFFSRDEALKAMKKDKEKIQHRYIELFLQSESKPLLSLEDGRPLGLNVDRQFGPGGGDRGFGPDSMGRYDGGGYGGFPSRKRPFEGVSGERPYRSTFGERGYNLPPERPFGSASERFGSSAVQRFGPLSEKPYSTPSDRFGSSAEKPFGSANKRFATSGEHSYRASEDRPYGVRGVASTGNLNSLGYNGVNQSYSNHKFSTFRSESRYGGGAGSQRERSSYFSTGKMYTKSTYPLLAGHGGINSMIGGTNYHAF